MIDVNLQHIYQTENNIFIFFINKKIKYQLTIGIENKV